MRLLAALFLAAPAAAQEADPVTPASIVAESAPEEWVAIAPQDLLVMELAPDAQGRVRQVVIQLLPPPFSQPWVENIRTLARAHWWDGTSVYRVVDNWVAQWGGGEGEEFAEKPLSEGVVSPDAPYAADGVHRMIDHALGEQVAIFEQVFGTRIAWPFGKDAYAPHAFILRGWPLAADDMRLNAWPVHCYGHVGVARDLAPDTGTGAELYAVIGHAPRQLDRNIAVIGRVIEGIAHLSTLPRGTGDAGVYETRAEDTPILSVRLGSDLSDPPAFEYLSTTSASFARYVASRANRNDAFYTVPAGGVDICNVQVPIRRTRE
ncbi:peptidylprolyl isomerase [Altererythrobacter lauratis]|uniref:Peptidylprolyl isomerase n=1 Tax=Alteraurantiacibacter lauratis TaxID=2054627 RepID=A0ABV7EJJ9_9SPHN